MTAILDTLERIPAQFVAVFIGVVVVWVSLRVKQDRELRQRLAPALTDFTITYILVARLSGLLLHPALLAHLSIWTLLAQAPSSGWLFGLIAAYAVMLWRMQRAGTLHPRTLHVLTDGAFLATSVWLVIRLFVDKSAYLERDIGLLAATVIILLLSRSRGREITPYLQRLSAAFAVVVLLTSTLVPRLEPFAHLTTIQWFGVIVLAASLAVEAFQDWQKRHDGGRTKADQP